MTQRKLKNTDMSTYTNLNINERINFKSAYSYHHVGRVLIVSIEQANTFGADNECVCEPVNPYNPAHLFTPAEIRQYRRLPN